jgi:CubicO group peptidase (beta-lactamase class C family)
MNTAPHTILAILALLGVLLLPASAAAAATQPSAPVRTDSSADIDAWVTDRMTARGVPGTAVAVVRGGDVVHLAGYGAADTDGRAVTPDTPFIIGSASKPFTAVVIGQLVEEGRLSWNEPVWPYLSQVADDAPDGFETVTVEQLLTHTAGLSMSVGTAGTVTIREGPDALDHRVDELLSRRLSGVPGEDFEYSNAGFMLLAAVAEQVTGRAFADQLHDRVFDPLGMTGSFATADDARAAQMATGHQQWFGRWRPVELPYDDAGVPMGYIASTASDLAKFMQAHLESHPTIPASATDIISDTVAPTGWDTPLDAGYGHGWFIDERAGTPVASHPGSLGHFTAHILLAPDADGLGIVVVSNASAFLGGHEAQYDIGLGLIDLLLGQEPQPSNPSALMVFVVPVVAWLIMAALLAALVRDVVRLLLKGLPAPRRRGAGGWVHALLPGVALIASGGGLLLAAPLGLARHFYPDGGWAVTASAWIALTWGLMRVVHLGLRPRAGAAN